MREGKISFDAVLFDLDGTLVDSVEDIAASANDVRAHMGLPPLLSQTIQTYIGDGVQALLEQVLRTQEISIVDQAITLWTSHYLKHCLDHTGLYPGIKEMLQGLCVSQIPMGVVTNKPTKPSEVILKGLGILNLFQVVIGGDKTSKRKPDPEPLQFAMECMKIHSEHVLVIGDSPNDVLGAKNANLISCGVLWGIGPQKALRAAQPNYLVNIPHDVLQIVNLSFPPSNKT